MPAFFNMPNYIKNKDMLIEWNLSLEKDEVTKPLQDMFFILVKHVSRRFHYKNEEDRFDCEQTAYLHLFTNWRNFNPEKSTNAFAYGTEIVKRAFASSYGYIYKKKGEDPANPVTLISYHQANDGNGIYNL